MTDKPMRAEPADLPSNEPEHETIDASRRQVMAAAGGIAAALLGGLSPGAAEAASGIGFVGSAQAQDAQTPVGAKWWPSRWGAEDQAGASNHITPEKILEALKLVKSGKVYEMGRVYESSMPKFGERGFALRIPGSPTGGPLGKNQIVWYDEFLSTEIGQVGTQFDGLGHIGVAVKGPDRTEMRFYNGFTANDIGSPYGLKKIGIEHVKPILTRGLLLDIQAVKGRNMNVGEEVTMADVKAALAKQGIQESWLKPGDAVFFNTGHGALWNKDNATYGKGEPGPGMEVGRWLVSKEVTVVGGDSWGVECVPNPDGNLAFPVHQELIAKNGIFIHENLDTAGLAADKVYTFLYIMTPLRIKGGTGSPGRPVAIV
jgi:kynurenine formamidase